MSTIDSREDGFILILFLIALSFLFGFGAIALESANFFHTQLQIQKASDLASIVATDIYLKGSNAATVESNAQKSVRVNLEVSRYKEAQINSIDVQVNPEDVTVNAAYDRKVYFNLPDRFGLPNSVLLKGTAQTRVPQIALELVLDKSASMLHPMIAGGGRTRMDNLKDAITATLRRMKGIEDRLGVILYDNRPEVILEMGDPWDLTALTALINATVASGGTGLSSAHELGRDSILNSTPAIPATMNKFLFIVTDGSVGFDAPLRVTPSGFNQPAFQPNITSRVSGFPFEVWDYYLNASGPGCGEGPSAPGCGMPPINWESCDGDVNCLVGGVTMGPTLDSLEAEGQAFDIVDCGERLNSPTTGTPKDLESFVDSCVATYFPGMQEMNDDADLHCVGDDGEPRLCEADNSCCTEPGLFQIVNPDGSFVTAPGPVEKGSWVDYHNMNNILEADYSRKRGIYVYALYAGPEIVPDPLTPFAQDTLFKRITMDPLGDTDAEDPRIPSRTTQYPYDLPGKFITTENNTDDFFRQYSRVFNSMRFERVS